MEGFNVTAALAAILSGGLLIGAIFMATDYVTSPATWKGKLIFGIGAGLLTFLIRYFGVYPEGVSFAILFMNILTPYIESWTAHKVFGGKKA
jgi:electron transport complex protein RnfD